MAETETETPSTCVGKEAGGGVGTGGSRRALESEGGEGGGGGVLGAAGPRTGAVAEYAQSGGKVGVPASNFGGKGGHRGGSEGAEQRSSD